MLDTRADVGEEEDQERTYRQEQRRQYKATDEADTKQTKKTQKKKKLEPSLKWKTLGMEEYKEPYVLCRSPCSA